MTISVFCSLEPLNDTDPEKILTEVFPLEAILAEDKLLALWIPHEYAYSLEDAVWSSILPIYVDNISDNNFYLTDKVTDLNTTEELFMLHLSEAKNFKVVSIFECLRT